MSAPTTSAPEEVFDLAIDESLKEWKSFQLSVDHGMGGQYTAEKLVWMRQTIHEFFRQNSQLMADEVEEFVSEIVDNEFDTQLEDGSCRVFAVNLCRYYQMCVSGRHQEVTDRLADIRRQRDVKSASNDSRVAAVEEALEELDINGTDDQMNGNELTDDEEVPQLVEVEPEDEGWTRVDRRHKR